MLDVSNLWSLVEKKKSTYFSSRLAQSSGGHEDTRAYTRSLIFDCEHIDLGFPVVSVSKESACNAGDPGSIPGLGRSPGVGNSNPLHYSCLENPTDRGAWWTTAHGVTRVWHDRITNHHMLTYFAFQIKFAFPLFIILITLWVLYYQHDVGSPITLSTMQQIATSTGRKSLLK